MLIYSIASSLRPGRPQPLRRRAKACACTAGSGNNLSDITKTACDCTKAHKFMARNRWGGKSYRSTIIGALAARVRARRLTTTVPRTTRNTSMAVEPAGTRRRSYQAGGGGAHSAARWLTTGKTVSFGRVRGRLGTRFSQDHINFTASCEALLAIDGGSWNRQGDPHELIAYRSCTTRGPNQLSNKRNLVYTDIQPNKGFGRRYLLFQPIGVSR
jgi:hypothetical protein